MDSHKLFSFACSFEKIAKKPWADKPKGWTDKSVKDYSKTMMEGKKHPFTACVNKMKGKVETPEKFCGSIKDKFTGNKKWRSTDRKKNKKD